MKPKRVSIYLDDEEQAALERLLRMFGPPFRETDIVSMVLGAGFRAVASEKFSFKLPLKFRISNEPAEKRDAA